MSATRRKQLLAAAKEVKRECINNGSPAKDFVEVEDLLFEFVEAYLEDHGK
jgi:hypothetical protein